MKSLIYNAIRIPDGYILESHDKVREVLKCGNRGKDGKQPLKWVALKDMLSSDIAAYLCIQPNMKHDHRISMENEITYRETL